MHSPNLTQDNVARIRELFPGCVTEARGEGGSVTLAVDFDLLRQELADVIVEGPQERYHLNWPGKREALLTANAPIAKALRPVREESVDFDTTRNLFIEGDNLDALKLLQEAYLAQVKMIYIDPPYNTGNDFIYEDDFAEDAGAYLRRSNQVDEAGNRLSANSAANGRFHSDWLSMMYPRLKLARNLLRDDGVIFISIDDREIENLKKICEEVFGASNFVADLIWANREGGGSSDSKLFRIKHEHILCFAKNIEKVDIAGVPVGNEDRYKSSDEYVKTRGKYYLQKMGMGTIQYSASLDYPVTAPDGTIVMPADNNGGRKACWRWSKPKLDWGLENGFIEIKKDSKGIWTVYSKQYLNCDNEGNLITRTQRPMGIIEEFSSTQATKLLESMGLGAVFNYAKPVELIRYLCQRVTSGSDLILDFFAGSATTAHAVMQLNAEDGGRRKFIMVQLPEPCDEKSEAFKMGYKSIAEISKERIRRAGRKISSESADAPQQESQRSESASAVDKGLDLGFRVLKIDSSNMADVYYAPDSLSQSTLDLFVDNIKPDRKAEDLLFQVMLDWGVDLALPIARETVQGKEVFIVDDGALAACFDAHGDIDETFVKALARRQPLRVVFRDAGFRDSAAKINVEQIFKLLSPASEVKSI